jgi:hypothetical protein
VEKAGLLIFDIGGERRGADERRDAEVGTAHPVMIAWLKERMEARD